MQTDKCLGPLKKIKVWHDNSGKGESKGWFCEQINIEDVQEKIK